MQNHNEERIADLELQNLKLRVNNAELKGMLDANVISKQRKENKELCEEIAVLTSQAENKEKRLALLKDLNTALADKVMNLGKENEKLITQHITEIRELKLPLLF